MEYLFTHFSGLATFFSWLEMTVELGFLFYSAKPQYFLFGISKSNSALALILINVELFSIIYSFVFLVYLQLTNCSCTCCHYAVETSNGII